MNIKKLSLMLLIIVMVSSLMTTIALANVVTIRIAHPVSEAESTHRTAVTFKEYVEKESKGQIKVEIYPNAQLGGDLQLMESVANGTIQMAIVITSVLTAYDPIFGLLDLPFLLKDADTGFKALDGDLGFAFDKKLEAIGVKSLGYNYTGSRCISNNIRPINEPKDLKDIKMRVMESPVYINMFKMLGANPTPMSFGELYTGLQQGTVDGQDNSPLTTYTQKFYEVQKYYSLTNHTYSYQLLAINLDFFNSLSSEHQKIITDGTKQFLIDAQRTMEINDNIEIIEKLKEAGMQVNEITPENLRKFKDALMSLHNKYKEEYGQEWFDLIDRYNQ